MGQHTRIAEAGLTLPAATSPLGTALRYTAPIVITATALLAALAHVEFSMLMVAVNGLNFVSLSLVVTALCLGALLASLRLRMIAHDIGYPMSVRDAIAALSLGQVAGSLFFQIVGQTIARSAFLSRRGMPLAGTIVMTGYERLAALFVSLLLAAAGAWHLFGRITLDLHGGGAEFIRLVVGGTMAIMAGAAFAWGKKIIGSLRHAIGPAAIGQTLRVLLLSIAIQLATMTAYIAGARALAPGIPVGDIAAAAAVVMLAAALPISLAGWGIRELSAIYALGIVGLPREVALVVAIIVGLAALAVVAFLGLVSVTTAPGERTTAPIHVAPRQVIDYGAVLAWCIPVASAMAVFFQIYLPLTTSQLNVNLADPLAVTGAALFIAGLIKSRELPTWRLPNLNIHLVLMTVVLIAAFVHGWTQFGWSTWAFTNRTVGWFVLLAYMATGALIVDRGGVAGYTLLLRTYVAAALAIIVLDVATFTAIIIGVKIPKEIFQYRMEGFSQNPNAFALQLIFAIGAIIIAAPKSRARIPMLAIAFVGLWFSASRSGVLALVVVAIAAVASGAINLRSLFSGVVLALSVVLFIQWLPEILVATVRTFQTISDFVVSLWSGSDTLQRSPFTLPAPKFSTLGGVISSEYQSSNAQRIESLYGGWEMFIHHPLIGAGLGAFIENYTRSHGTPLVIHSTPLWLLAEAGIIGLLAFTAPFIRVLKHEIYRPFARDEAQAFLLLALLGFATMAMVHDLLFQRALWLLCGASLALCSPDRSQSKNL